MLAFRDCDSFEWKINGLEVYAQFTFFNKTCHASHAKCGNILFFELNDCLSIGRVISAFKDTRVSGGYIQKAQ